MTSRERALDRANRRGAALVGDLGRQLREARMEHGLSQAFVGRAVGLSRSAVSRIERGTVPAVSVVNLARLMSVVGLELSARAYPSGSPLRDQGQVNVLGRLKGQLAVPLIWRAEVPVGGAGDLRAWDLVISNGQDRVAVEAETRLTDLQAVQRRIALKSRDSGIGTVILLLAASRTNRNAVRLFHDAVMESFPVPGSEVLGDLRMGRLPSGSTVILL
ncbi:MAG TPA: helix-turn-helix transcriptional regulator [Candidatus Limnocylindrales bacterium]|jgi:transcriptional regulator with XRE-family HTH domain